MSDQRTYTVRLKVDGKEIPNSVNDLTKAQRELRKELRGLEQGTTEYIKKSQQLNQVSAQLDKIRKDVNGVGNAWKKQKSMWDQAKTTFAGTFAALSVQGAIASVGQLGMRMAEFVKQLTKQRREITRLTDVTGRDLDVVSAKIQSIVDTYDKDFNEVLLAANAFSKQMNVELSDALELMQSGFALGADASDEFLSNLKEYPAQFKAAGLSAEQAVAIITQQAKTGIFSDKGADTIKEGTLRLREMTKATREALDAIGISSNQLEADLRSNSISYFEAIQIVAQKLDELPPQSVEVGTALADIFGGAGEDAGLNYITMLGDVELALTNLENPTTKLAEANERLALAYQKMGDDDGFLTNLEIRWKNFSASMLETLEFLSNYDWTPQGYRQFLSDMSGFNPNAPTGPDPAPTGFQFQTRPGATPGSINAQTGLSADLAAAADLVDQFAIDFNNFTEEVNRPDVFEGLEEATNQYQDQFNNTTQQLIDADNARTQQSIRNSEARQAEEERELELRRQAILMAVQQGIATAENAETLEDYGNAAIQIISREIKAQIAAGIAKAISSQLGTGPLGVITAGLAGLAAGAIFNKMIPSFSTGGYTGSGNLGMGRNSGGYIRGVVEEDEYVINRHQLRDPYVANFASYLEAQKMGGSPNRPMQVNASASLDAAEFAQSVREFQATVSVLQKHGIPANLYDSTLRDIDERKTKYTNAKQRASLRSSAQ